MITQLLEVIKIEEVLTESSSYMKKRQDEMIKKGKNLEAAVYAIQQELKRNESKRLFHCDKAIRIEQ